jgi:hypothetical protein
MASAAVDMRDTAAIEHDLACLTGHAVRRHDRLKADKIAA